MIPSQQMTYSIGCGFRRGMFNPLRRILLKDPKDDNSVADGAQALPVSDPGSRWIVVSRIKWRAGPGALPAIA